MANWQRTLSLKDVWDRADDDPIQDLARIVAERLRKMVPFGIEALDEERTEIAEEFYDLADDEGADTRDFDLIMGRLYDWADTPLDEHWNGRKACWVETF